MRVLALLVLLPAPVLAEVPPPDYFTGVYERVGRRGTEPPELVNDLIRITPDRHGDLVISPCVAGGNDPILDRDSTLDFVGFGDVENLLATREGEPWLACQFFNDMDNYPIIACHGASDQLITLWPANDRAGECPG